MPEDGVATLPTMVELVNGYRLVELEPDCCMVALLLPEVKGNVMTLETSLDSDVNAVRAVPFPPADPGPCVLAPNIVELPMGVVNEAVPLIMDVIVFDSGKVVAAVEFVNGYGVDTEVVSMPDVRPLDEEPVIIPVGGEIVADM
ncbi:hypothetical protein RRF57_002643 [Xylaria bambusicola]|uniref:Uncharacterized protein n=1 Tax=Xylaria bambusicola TaxID=326684 RepID=A0AAN7UEY5_9PEZI